MAEIVTLRDEGLGNSSYLVDLGDGRGLVLDPSRDPGPYPAAAARRRGLRLAWTAETHLHADFVSGSRELATSGATVVAPAAAPLQFPHRGLGDGDEVDLGALSIQLRSAFATWLGWLVADDRPLVMVVDPDQDRADLVRQALKVGYERLAGELDGGMAAWQAAGLPVASLPLAGLAGVGGRRVLDVRQDAEFAAGHIPGAAHVELGALTHQLGGLPGGPLAVVCGHGERAMTAASLLQRQGRADVSVVGGGTSAWAAAGRRLEPRR